jgi:uncharacterized protein
MGEPASFSDVLADELRYYVYRLMDLRHGETFYVSKGKGNRLFAHARGGLSAGHEALDAVLRV